jgi:hypothetical protein
VFRGVTETTKLIGQNRGVAALAIIARGDNLINEL